MGWGAVLCGTTRPCVLSDVRNPPLLTDAYCRSKMRKVQGWKPDACAIRCRNTAGSALGLFGTSINLEELALCDGKASSTIHFSVAGVVYDVSEATESFGDGGPYRLWAGKDATYSLAKMSLDPRELTTPLDASVSEKIECRM